MLNCWGSCNPSKISWVIWLLYWDQLHLHLSHNSFGLLLQYYGPVQTHKVPKLDYVACSSIQLSYHIQSEAVHNMSATIIRPTTEGTYHGLNCFIHMVCWKLTNTKILQNFWLILVIIENIITFIIYFINFSFWYLFLS